MAGANLTPYDIAQTMMGTTDLPLSLRKMIEDAERLCVAAGGTLTSREAIAVLIVQWREFETLSDNLADSEGQCLFS